jgi:BASS family bile acid:Na+ symporter
LEALFNLSVAVFIVLTMLSAGFTTTFEQIGSILRKPVLIILVLFVGIVLRPLVGWGGAELFSLAVPAFIALVITACAPGAPFGAKAVMIGKADVSSGAVLQVMLAVVMSFTFAPTANLIIGAADLGSDVALPVAEILRTVVVLQVLPFIVGILMRHWTEDTALTWNDFAAKGSSLLFVFVLAGALLGSWETLVDLIGDRVLLAAGVVSGVMIVLGYFISQGSKPTRQATGLIEPISNSGPCFAAVAIAFNNDPAILGAITGIIVIQMVVGVGIASFWGRDSDEENLGEVAAPEVST